MMGELFHYFVFFFCASLIVASAINLILNPNPVYGALGMAGGLFLLTVIYLLLNQEFFAAIQLLAYAGAIMVLFLFIIMLLNLKRDLHKFRSNISFFLALLLGGFLFSKISIVIFYSFSNTNFEQSKQQVGSGSLKEIGTELFTNYLVPFEFIGFLLLVAVIGAVLISKKNLQSKKLS